MKAPTTDALIEVVKDGMHHYHVEVCGWNHAPCEHKRALRQLTERATVLENIAAQASQFVHDPSERNLVFLREAVEELGDLV